MDKTLAATLLLAMLTVAKGVAEGEAPPCPCPKCTRRREEAAPKEGPGPDITPEQRAINQEAAALGAVMSKGSWPGLIPPGHEWLDKKHGVLADHIATLVECRLQATAQNLNDFWLAEIGGPAYLTKLCEEAPGVNPERYMGMVIERIEANHKAKEAAKEPAAASSEPPEFGADVGTDEQTGLLYKPQSDVSRILTQMADVFPPSERASIQMLAYLLDAKGPSVTHRTMSAIVRRTLV